MRINGALHNLNIRKTENVYTPNNIVLGAPHPMDRVYKLIKVQIELSVF